MQIKRARQSKNELPVLPMVNVVFLLLVFFLVAGSIQKVEVVPIDPPIAESGKVLDEGHIVIALGRYEEIVLNDDMVTEDDIVPMVSKQLKDHPNRIITIKADSSLPAKKLIRMMDYVKAAGGQNLSLVTQAP